MAYNDTKIENIQKIKCGILMEVKGGIFTHDFTSIKGRIYTARAPYF